MNHSRVLRQHVMTRSACSRVNASGNAVSALALSVRARTLWKLTQLSRIKTRRDETQPARFGQPVGHSLLDHPRVQWIFRVTRILRD